MPAISDDDVEELTVPRERFVPLHTTDLVDFLCKHPALKKEDVEPFRRVADIILALLHHLYRQRHTQLTYAYAPLDPDRDTRLIHVPDDAERDRLTDEVFQRVADALALANYRPLGSHEIDRAIRVASQWGIRMRVDFSKLRRIEIYARGATLGQRERRSWRKGSPKSGFKFRFINASL